MVKLPTSTSPSTYTNNEPDEAERDDVHKKCFRVRGSCENKKAGDY